LLKNNHIILSMFWD